MIIEALTRTEVGGLFVVAAALAAIFGPDAFTFPTLEPDLLGTALSVGLSALLVLIIGFATLLIVNR